MWMNKNRQHGISLIELVAVIVILAIALTGATLSISSAVRRSADTLLETRAVALAQSYLDEILGKRFDEHSAPRGIPPCRDCTDEQDFGPDLGETRATFDDVDDYHGLQEGFDLDPPAPLRDSEGEVREGYDNFRVAVSVRYLRPCDDEADWFNFATHICSPDLDEPDEVEESETTLLSAAQSGKLITVTVMHSSQPSGWHFSVYKANF